MRASSAALVPPRLGRSFPTSRSRRAGSNLLSNLGNCDLAARSQSSASAPAPHQPAATWAIASGSTVPRWNFRPSPSLASPPDSPNQSEPVQSCQTGCKKKKTEVHKVVSDSPLISVIRPPPTHQTHLSGHTIPSTLASNKPSGTAPNVFESREWKCSSPSTQQCPGGTRTALSSTAACGEVEGGSGRTSAPGRAMMRLTRSVLGLIGDLFDSGGTVD